MGRLNSDVDEAQLRHKVWVLDEAQIGAIEPYSPLLHGIPWADDCQIVRGIKFMTVNRFRWLDTRPI